MLTLILGLLVGDCISYTIMGPINSSLAVILRTVPSWWQKYSGQGKNSLAK